MRKILTLELYINLCIYDNFLYSSSSSILTSFFSHTYSPFLLPSSLSPLSAVLFSPFILSIWLFYPIPLLFLAFFCLFTLSSLLPFLMCAPFTFYFLCYHFPSLLSFFPFHAFFQSDLLSFLSSPFSWLSFFVPSGHSLHFFCLFPLILSTCTFLPTCLLTYPPTHIPTWLRTQKHKHSQTHTLTRTHSQGHTNTGPLP